MKNPEDRPVTLQDLKACTLLSQLAGSMTALAVVGEAASDAHLREIVGRWAALVRLTGEDLRWGFEQLVFQVDLLAKDPQPRCQRLAQRIKVLYRAGLAGDEWQPRS
jgi:hypothetical protein